MDNEQTGDTEAQTSNFAVTCYDVAGMCESQDWNTKYKTLEDKTVHVYAFYWCIYLFAWSFAFMYSNKEHTFYPEPTLQNKLNQLKLLYII